MTRSLDPARKTWAERYAPSLEQIEALARDAFDKLPGPFRGLVGDVSFSVAELPDDDVLDELGMDSAYDLLGLFEGVGLAHASAAPPTGALPNRIWLYRLPILDYWAEYEETLGAVVTHVLVHEIGHHFGLSDEDMEAIEARSED